MTYFFKLWHDNQLTVRYAISIFTILKHAYTFLKKFINDLDD